jgi:eukaryotic-like serine/threonine-protein kinase
MPETQFDVFVSYATVDAEVVEPFVRLLKQDGFSVWLDVEQMAGGRTTMAQLADGILASSHTIACLTDAYLQRSYTNYELAISAHRDPAGERARTILVKLRALTTTRVPNYLAHLTVCDLTTGYAAGYSRIAEMIRDYRRPLQVTAPDLDQLFTAPFDVATDPATALFQVRQASQEIAREVYRRTFGELPEAAGFDNLVERLVVSGRLPADINGVLAAVQVYGKHVVRDDVGGYEITRDAVQPALVALRRLIEWTFPDRVRHASVTDVFSRLPAGDASLDEKRIPETPYRLRGPALGVNSLGTLYAGRSMDKPATVVLTSLPESNDDAFLHEMERFRRLPAENVVAPRDAGRVLVEGRREGLYVVFPPLLGVSAQDLVDRVGPLPARVAYEIGLGVAKALIAFHGAYPPIVHGDIKPAHVLVDTSGRVRVLCVGRQIAAAAGDPEQTTEGRVDSVFYADLDQRSGTVGGPSADLYALRAVLTHLLSGSRPEPGVDEVAALSGSDRAVIAELSRVTDADAARRLLEEARRSAPEAPGLGRMVQRHLDQQAPATGARPDEPSVHVKQPGLVDVAEVRVRAAWPSGDGLLLCLEQETASLTLRDPTGRICWEDADPVAVRAVVAGPDDWLVVAGWDGRLRSFVAGELVAATRLDAAIGDVRFIGDHVLVGTWGHRLLRMSREGGFEELLGTESGVHRIAVSESGERFTVADLAGGLGVYRAHPDIRRTGTHPPAQPIRDLAYAGSRLVLLGEGELTAIPLHGSPSEPEPKPGAFRLLPVAKPGHCMVLAREHDGLQGWLIDESDRHVPDLTVPGGRDIVSVSADSRRFAVSLGGGGFAYWRDGKQVQSWSDAVCASLTPDGTRLAVVRPDRVELLADDP